MSRLEGLRHHDQQLKGAKDLYALESVVSAITNRTLYAYTRAVGPMGEMEDVMASIDNGVLREKW